MLVLEEGGEKPVGAELSKLMTARPGIEPRTHWWKASALTAASTLLPLELASNCFPSH